MDKAQRTIEHWRELAFNDLQKLLDEQGIKVSETAAAGSANRKELSAKTKEFRKLEGNDKLEQIKPLLKMYQSEIDSLTNRSKFAESCFLSVYKQLAEAPNPLPLLELASTRSEEVEGLKAKIADLEAQAAKRSDYDSVVKQLANQDKLINQRVTAKEAELNAYWDEKSKNWQSRESDLIKSLDENRAQVAVLQSKLESGDADKEDFKSAQATALERELERSHTKIAGLEARVADLRSEIEREKSTQKDTSEQIHLENENTKLSLRVEQLQREASNDQEAVKTSQSKLQAELEALQQSLGTAQKKLAQQSDYDQLRREIEFLRQIEFGDQEVEGGENSEALDILKGKNAKLNEDLKNLRLANGKLANENDGLQQSIFALQEQLKNTSQLVERLEGDLSTMSRDETFSTISGWTAIPRRVSPASSIRGGSTGKGQSAAAADSANNSGVSSDVLGIITQQRDRFKEKCLELEENLHRCKNSVTSLTKDIEALKTDNRELYEQLRLTGKAKNDRFKGVYDDELSSFHQLKSLELDRSSSGVNPLDQAFFAVVKKAVIDKTLRYAISLWAVVIHLLLVWLAI